MTRTATVPTAVGSFTVTKYEFKWLQEAFFAGLVAVTIVGLETLATFDVAKLSDPETYGLGLAGAAARAFGAAGLNVFVEFVRKGDQ